MKTNKTIFPMLSVALALLAILALPGTSRAALTFTLDQSTLTTQPGGLLTFTGTLTNTGTQTLFLNGDTFNLAVAGLTLDDTPFLTEFPLSLSGGGSATGDFFTVSVSPSTAAGFYDGTFNILGGSNSSAMSSIGTQSFHINIVSSAAAPEPGSDLLLLCGGTMLGIVGAVRQRRKLAIPTR